MKKWLLLLIHAVEALIVLAAVYFEPSYCVRGALWGEAFFEGRPTSYWRAQLARPNVDRMVRKLIFGQSGPGQKEAEPTQFERLLAFSPWANGPDIDVEITVHLFRSFLTRKDDAKPVLRELLGDPSSSVRAFARVGLDIDPPFE